MRKLIIFFTFFFITLATFAQDPQNGMAVDMRSSGKIYVVVAVITLIFIGIALYQIANDVSIMKGLANSTQVKVYGAAGLVILIALAIRNMQVLLF